MLKAAVYNARDDIVRRVSLRQRFWVEAEAKTEEARAGAVVAEGEVWGQRFVVRGRRRHLQNEDLKSS